MLLAVGAACGGTQQSKPSPTPDIETTVVAKFEEKRAADASADASKEAKVEAMVEPTAQVMPTVTPGWGRL